jgi:hypothetical protein
VPIYCSSHWYSSDEYCTLYRHGLHESCDDFLVCSHCDAELLNLSVHPCRALSSTSSISYSRHSDTCTICRVYIGTIPTQECEFRRPTLSTMQLFVWQAHKTLEHYGIQFGVLFSLVGELPVCHNLLFRVSETLMRGG